MSVQLRILGQTLARLIAEIKFADRTDAMEVAEIAMRDSTAVMADVLTLTIILL